MISLSNGEAEAIAQDLTSAAEMLLQAYTPAPSERDALAGMLSIKASNLRRAIAAAQPRHVRIAGESL